ncbi:stalk domain-containing protein [Fictibacillus sp. NPDC058756]
MLVLSFNLNHTSAASAPTVSINGVKQVYDQPPVIHNGRTLVPLRGIFEKLGATVQWHQSTQTITAVKGDIDVWLKLGSKNVKVNGVSKTIDVPAQAINGRTLVPLRFVSEVFGAQVSWNSATNRIDIIYNGTMPSKQMKVHYIDVGQGDSIYIKGPEGEDIIIDAGGKGKGDEVVSYLQSQKVDDIEIMISTHPDADHIGGLDEVLAAYKVESVYAPQVSHTTQAYEDFLLAVKNEGLTIKAAKTGVLLNVKGVSAKFIAPYRDYGTNINDWSAVLHVTYNQKSFLFTGDAELASEKDMIASKQLLKADVLKVSHHGADNGSSEEFLKLVQPKYSVISVGANNSYGHPTAGTLSRLKAIGSAIYRTDLSGNITFTTDGTQLSVKTER